MSLRNGVEVTRPIEDILQDLKNKGIHLSHQRIKVLEYLTQNLEHPTVDRIYMSLQQEIPTLSKTTIYNTLKMLEKAGIVKLISIDGNEACFDICTEPHGHFKCEDCGNIYDFAVTLDSFSSKDLEDFYISDKNVYFKGVRPQCLSNINGNVKGEE